MDLSAFPSGCWPKHSVEQATYTTYPPQFRKWRRDPLRAYPPWPGRIPASSISGKRNSVRAAAERTCGYSARIGRNAMSAKLGSVTALHDWLTLLDGMAERL